MNTQAFDTELITVSLCGNSHGTHIITFNTIHHSMNLIFHKKMVLESISQKPKYYALAITEDEIETQIAEAREYCLELFPQGNYNHGYNSHSWTIHVRDGNNFGGLIAGEELKNGKWISL